MPYVVKNKSIYVGVEEHGVMQLKEIHPGETVPIELTPNQVRMMADRLEEVLHPAGPAVRFQSTTPGEDLPPNYGTRYESATQIAATRGDDMGRIPSPPPGMPVYPGQTSQTNQTPFGQESTTPAMAAGAVEDQEGEDKDKDKLSGAAAKKSASSSSSSKKD